jgi:hypothetical protein
MILAVLPLKKKRQLNSPPPPKKNSFIRSMNVPYPPPTDMQGIRLSITSSLDVQNVRLSSVRSVDVQAVPLKTFIQFFEMPECQTFRERSVWYWTEKECRCRNQSGTGRRESSLALKCLGNGLRCWMTEC